MADKPIDYYAVLEISTTATQQQIRDAYKKAALKSHPDRVPSDSPERPARTKKFQRINDAYYTLSDPTRRRDYDAARTFHYDSYSSSDAADEEIPRPAASGGGFPWSAFGFGGGAKTNEAEQESFNNEQFGGVFEEMLREEGLAEGQNAQPTGKFWSLVGGLSGGAMGFIVANFPGALAGAVAGNRLGAVRDARGKSVYAVFQELPQGDKARLLSQLAGKVFATVVSGA
jgi:curved DNA-binding protein CbpA